MTLNSSYALLASTLLFALFTPTSGLAQDCKGTFVDGECVEGYVYVPDFMSPQDLKKAIEESKRMSRDEESKRAAVSQE